MSDKSLSIKKKNGRWYEVRKNLRRSKYLYIMILPAILYYLIFFYQPMYGAQIAFRQYIPSHGIVGSQWVGLRYFKEFIASPNFKMLIKNTLGISLYDILLGFPVPIILALLINEVNNVKLKKIVQTTIYLPHFISIVVVSGMVLSFLAPRTGLVNKIITTLGGQEQHFMANPGNFWTIYVLSGIWQSAGWNTIIYIAALTGIDPSIYEAAVVDGASRFQRLLRITLPSMVPTIMTMLILRMGSVFSVGYEKIMLLANDAVMNKADVILYFVYRRGVLNGDYSFATAVGLFNSVLNLLVVITFNKISRKLSDVSLW